MIYGIGTDIVSVTRLKDLWERYKLQFAKRILSQYELNILPTRKDTVHYLAKRFAAKEAIAKALGTGFTGKVQLTGMTIGNDAQGKPQVTFHEPTQSHLHALGDLKIHLSISDERDYAVAFALLEL